MNLILVEEKSSKRHIGTIGSMIAYKSIILDITELFISGWQRHT